MATALIRPLAWEPLYAAEAAQEMAKRQKNKTKIIKKKKSYSTKLLISKMGFTGEVLLILTSPDISEIFSYNYSWFSLLFKE